MEKRMNVFTWISAMFREFVTETVAKPEYKVEDIYECKKTGFTKAIIRLSQRHTIDQNISDIIINDDLIEGLDKRTIRAFTYLATVEKMKPDYSIVVQQMTNEIDEFILEIKSKNNKSTMKKSPSDISKDAILVAKFNSVDANRIGYLAGVRETVKEYQAIKGKN